MDATVGISALLETYGVKERIKCTLAGWSRGEFVVLKAPLTPGIRSRVTDGSQMAIRFLNKGDLVGFRAEYIDFVVRPFPLLFVSYPYKFETHTLRGKHRLECNLLGTISAAGRPYRGVVLDISPGGCKFFFDPGQDNLPRLQKGQSLEGYFQTLGNSKPHTFRAKVATLEKYKSHSEVSLIFDTKATTLPEDLTNYLDEVAEMLTRLKV